MREDLQQLRKYTIYAVGCPLFITLISATIEFLPHTINISIRPDFGIWRCFFANALSTFIYLYLPMLILQTSNVIFFWLTISNIRQTWRLTHSFDLTTKQNFQNTSSLFLNYFSSWDSTGWPTFLDLHWYIFYENIKPFIPLWHFLSVSCESRAESWYNCFVLLF